MAENIEDLIRTQNPRLYALLAPLVPYLSDPQEKTREKLADNEIPSESRWIDILDDLKLLTTAERADHLALLEGIINEDELVTIAGKMSPRRIKEFLKDYPILRALLEMSEIHDDYFRGLRVSACESWEVPVEIRDISELDFIRDINNAGLLYNRFPNVVPRGYSLERAVKELRLGLFYYLTYREGNPDRSILGVTVVDDKYLRFTASLYNDYLFTPSMADLLLAYDAGARKTTRYILMRGAAWILPSPELFRRITLNKDKEMLWLALKLLYEEDSLVLTKRPWVPDSQLDEIYHVILHHDTSAMILVKIYEEALESYLSYDDALFYCITNRRQLALQYLTTEYTPDLEFFATHVDKIEAMLPSGDYNVLIAMILKNCRAVLQLNPELRRRYAECIKRSDHGTISLI